MHRCSSIKFSIAESGYLRGMRSTHQWPAAMTFPHFPGGKLFSIDNQLPKPPQLVILTIDLSQFLKERVLH
ncbi:hypothetical protein [Vibrio gazogenes]|jgi:hypothetical protein|uniref:Uncharacterized protein n=1 Tax=Vibrio gazogenes DSM 21264 = NBRC 103151 TaxID=1123492 RepID=A0A1M5GK62_VIBGA|nr:hypothetical protein [Vibrio gazogenes]USP13851.1 hypothetical protein MKS89_00445 [Vibrio gazogenes]SHG04099.1 hypothetical protein SAMN02745781_03825 [Vibrio gazogenes DSM 21264] [Vibrio gazogenes DSM 21264 = NBRC 103151]SJN53252.1 hypothetical protein BQ6471_00347 [Vibrio gazogenes]